MKYRADIDGLRAIAVLAVLFFHANSSLFGGGFVGVDVFFVISGYLITTILTHEIDEGRFSIVSFYERRIRRILPPLLLVVSMTSIIAWVLFLPHEFRHFGRSITALTLFSSNILFKREIRYFEAPGDSKPLLHTWSLSVEEQFYLFYPLLLILIFRFLKNHRKPVIFAMATMSFAMSLLWIHRDQSKAFYLLQFRSWELMVGALLALKTFKAPESQWLSNALAFLGFALVGGSIILLTSNTPFPGVNAVYPCLGAALIIHSAGHRSTIVSRLLAQRPLVWVGLISYSLYLWHWPLFVFARYYLLRNPHGFEIAMIIMASFGLSTISYFSVEQPFRRKALLRSRRSIFAAAGIAMIGLAVFGLVVDLGKGLPMRFPTIAFEEVKGIEEWNDERCFLEPAQTASEWKEGQCFIVKNGNPIALLWGDSYAAHYVPGLIKNSEKVRGSILQYTASGCAPVFGYRQTFRPNCNAFVDRASSIIEQFGVRTVILSARWDLAMEHGLKLSELAKTIERLQGKGAHVVVIGQSPVFPMRVQDIFYRTLANSGVWLNKYKVDQSTMLNHELKKFINNADFIDPTEDLCEDQSCIFRDNAHFYIVDDGHFSVYGSQKMAAKILQRARIKGI